MEWHTQALLKAFGGCTTDDYKQRIIALRQRGVNPISINSWTRSANAYLAWSNAGFQTAHPKEQKIPATFSQDQITRLLAYHPKTKALRRAQVLVNDPRFQQLSPLQVYEVMTKVDPSLEGSSNYKLAMLADLMTRPPKSLGLAVTVKRHGNIYRAVCSFSKLHYTDPDLPQGFANRDQPYGKSW